MVCAIGMHICCAVYYVPIVPLMQTHKRKTYSRLADFHLISVAARDHTKPASNSFGFHNSPYQICLSNPNSETNSIFFL